MGLETGRTLRIWAVSDGRAGIEAQALGLAEAVAGLGPAEITLKRLAWRPWARRLPTRLVPHARWVLAAGSAPLEPPWPDVWIGAGRAAVPAAIALRRWSRGRSFVVQVQDPVRDPAAFDMVAPPLHDALSGAGVFAILGAPNRVTPARLTAEYDRFAARLGPLPQPIALALIGGRSKAFDLGPERAGELARELVDAVRASGGSLLVSFSRRTPARAEAVMRAALAKLPGWIWDGEGDNPYFAFLAAAEVVVVTADSINMATEASTAGKPVLIARVDGAHPRKARFHAELAARGLARPFAGDLAPWAVNPLDETRRAAVEVVRRLDARRAIA